MDLDVNLIFIFNHVKFDVYTLESNVYLLTKVQETVLFLTIISHQALQV